jgi:hypothetical protein
LSPAWHEAAREKAFKERRGYKTPTVLILSLAACLGGQAQDKLPSVPLDDYGGVTVQMAKPSGNFRVTKISNRWVILTPRGNPFWMLGVWNITTDDHIFPVDSGRSYTQRVTHKYGDSNLRWGPQQVRRLKSWGFNTIGPYSVSWVSPTHSDSRWPKDGTQPVKAPIVILARVSYYSFYNSDGYGTAPVKDLVAGVKPRTLAYQGGHFPDIFDPAFEAYANGMFERGLSENAMRNSPWVIGYMSDDTDDLWGFGAGSEFQTKPPGHANDNLALLSLITSPVQSANRNAGGSGRSVTYRNQKVYTKEALIEFLRKKYGTIAALNSSWGSTYTSFNSDGGWGTGNGLPDEDLRPNHQWLRSDTVGLSDFNNNIRTDLDAFLVQLTRRYFTICRDKVKKVNPNSLYLGITALGSWYAPPHKEVLQGAAGLIDLVATNIDPADQGQVDYMVQNLGEVPMFEWIGWRANPDSAMFNWPNETDLRTQAERSAAYSSSVKSMWTGTSRAGIHLFVGYLWWEFHDNAGEDANWGLVSLSDNAYDGSEASRATSRDQWGFATGGELRDYGDFLSGVRAVNHQTYVLLQTEMQKVRSNR